MNEHGEAAEPLAIEAHALVKSYVGGDGSVLQILNGVDLEVATGEAIAIVGQSGAGKSTLLHLLGGLDRPTAGNVSIAGQRIDALSDEQLAAVRNRRIGFVFSFTICCVSSRPRKM